MNPTLQALLKDREGKYPKNLEEKFPRVFEKIMNLWGTLQLEPYFSELFIDDKGNRQGFPKEVMAEIFFLSMLHDQVMGTKQNKGNDDVWSNLEVKRGLEEAQIEYSPRGFIRAVETGNARAIQLFIEAGVDLEQKNTVGWTPLMIASFTGSEKIAALLVNAGANISVRDNRGYTPLHWATYQGFTQITKLLVQKGAFVNSKSDMGLTPLLQASARGNTEIVQFLISKGAAVNESDQEGWTPLHKAVANCHKEVVELLMSAGADPTSQHTSGLTPLAIAKQKNDPEIIRRLNR